MVRTKGLPSEQDQAAPPPSRPPKRRPTSSTRSRPSSMVSQSDSSTIATADIPGPPALRSQEQAPALAPSSTSTSTTASSSPRTSPGTPTTTTRSNRTSNGGGRLVPPTRGTRNTAGRGRGSGRGTRTRRQPPASAAASSSPAATPTPTSTTSTPDPTMSENQFQVKAFMASLGTQENINLPRTPPGAIPVQGVNSRGTSAADWDNVGEPSDRDGDDTIMDDSHPPLVAAHLAPDEESVAAILAERLERQITEQLQQRLKQEVEAQLSTHRHQQQQQLPHQIAEAVITDVSTSADGTILLSQNGSHSDNFKVCGLRRRTWGFLLVLFLLLIGGVVAGVYFYLKSQQTSKEAPLTTPTTSPTSSPVSPPPTANAMEGLRQELEPFIVRTDADLLPFEDPSSPQSLALEWLSTDPISLDENHETKDVLERYVLAVLYYAMDGPNWTWSGVPYLTDQATCDWNNALPWDNDYALGIYCLNVPTVDGIAMQQLGLSGSIPWELSLLSNLANLEWDKNSIGGTLPTEFGRLGQLQVLWLPSNELTGPLPNYLPSSLQSLDLTSNKFTGTLPSSWGDEMADLFWLGLSYNQLTGSIPSSWQGLVSLQELDLGSNQLNGTLPSSIGQAWSNLNSLFLEQNLLSGSLPTELGYLTNLRYSLINYNDFTGTIPTELAQLSNLQSFSFDNNRLIGSLNETFCNTEDDSFFISSLITLQADCLPDWDGQVEIDCSCCTACCSADGSYCEEFI